MKILSPILPFVSIRNAINDPQNMNYVTFRPLLHTSRHFLWDIIKYLELDEYIIH